MSDKKQVIGLVLDNIEKFKNLITHRFGLEKSNESILVINKKEAIKSVFIPNIVWLIALTYLGCNIFLSKLTICRKVCATGDNKEADRLSGIKVKAIKTLVFMVSGLLASLGGVVLMSSLNSGQPVAGLGFELSAIAAAIIGGTSLTKGGIEGVAGTLFGTVFIATLQNGLVILNVSSF